MLSSDSLTAYLSAKKSGLKEYHMHTGRGESGYLPALESMLKDIEIVAQVELGTFEIPLKKIIGTNSHSRAVSFASNFMPIAPESSEFASKWISVYNHQIEDGITDPVQVYEYLNFFYVVEGNKRVSVLKYLDAYSINASITRLIPKKDPTDHTNQLYYEFLYFNKITGLYSIWLSRRHGFRELLKLLEGYNPQNLHMSNKFLEFEAFVYNVFRRVYHKNGGGQLSITTGDAFLEYAKLCGIPDSLNEDEITVPVRGLIKELKYFKKDEAIDIQTSPTETSQGLFSTITSFIKPQKQIRAAFVYARTIETSGWTYAHEIGRKQAQEALGDLVSTTYVEGVPEGDSSYEVIKSLAEQGNDVIFTTSPVFRNATLRCALEHPEVKLFNCSESIPNAHVPNYYGRTYEPRFLTGIIAGSMTKNNIIGYSATSPTPEVISCINSFALGAKMVNPYAQIKVAWTREWNSHAKFHGVTEKLIEEGADIISNLVLTIPRNVTREYGVYSMLCSISPEEKKPEAYLAAPIWRWGVFYEKILRNVLNGTIKTVGDMFPSHKLVSFWWGIASGVLDIYYSKSKVPYETQRLVQLMRRAIMIGDFEPFTGPLYDNKKNLRAEEDQILSSQQILSMDWLAENVSAEPYQES